MPRPSSVTVIVHEGERVEKGQELGWFSYGGSTLALVFQPGAIDRFTVKGPGPGKGPDDGPPILVVPGFLATDRTTTALREALAADGWRVHGWDNGWNLGVRAPQPTRPIRIMPPLAS